MSDDTELNPNQNFGALCVVLLSTVTATLAVSSVNILLPELRTALGADYASVQWVAISYMLTLSASLIAVGRVCDLIDKRRLYVYGISIFTLGAGLGGLSNQIEALMVWRAIQGVGAAILVTTNFAMISDIAPRHKTGAAIGLMGSMSAIGTASGPVLGGVLADILSWQSVFLIHLPLGMILLGLTVRYIPAGQKNNLAAMRVFDAKGAALLAIMIFTAALCLKYIGQVSFVYILALVFVSGATFYVFFRHQKKTPLPVLQLSILTNRTLGVSIGMNFVVCCVVMAALIIGPFYLTSGLGLSLSATGLVMAVSPVIVALTSFGVGHLISDGTIHRVISLGLMFILIGTLCLSVLRLEMGVIAYIGCLVLTAIGYASFTASNNTLIMQGAVSGQKGQISALLNLSKNLGLLAGATLMSTLFEITTQASALGVISPVMAETGMNSVYRFIVPFLCVAMCLRHFAFQKSHRLHN